MMSSERGAGAVSMITAANTPIQGKIEKIFPTYGFVISNEGQRFFFHFGTSFTKPEFLQVGDDVEFFIGQDVKSGRLHAQRVRQIPLDGRNPPPLRVETFPAPFKPAHSPPGQASADPGYYAWSQMGLRELNLDPNPLQVGANLRNYSAPVSMVSRSPASSGYGSEMGSPPIFPNPVWGPGSDPASGCFHHQEPLMTGEKEGSEGQNHFQEESEAGSKEALGKPPFPHSPVATQGLVISAPKDYNPLARGLIVCEMAGHQVTVEFAWLSLKFPQERSLVTWGTKVQMLAVWINQRWEARQVVPLVPEIRGQISDVHNQMAIVELADCVKRVYFPLRLYLGSSSDIVPGVSVQFVLLPSPKGEIASRLTLLPAGSVVIFRISQACGIGKFEVEPKHGYPGFLTDLHTNKRIAFWQKDWKKSHGLRHGDLFQFRVRTDLRNNEQTATQVEFLPEYSFAESQEPRERGRVVFVEPPNGVWIHCEHTRPRWTNSGSWNDFQGLVWVALSEFVVKEPVGLPTTGTVLEVTVVKCRQEPKLRGERALIVSGGCEGGPVCPKFEWGLVEKMPEEKPKIPPTNSVDGVEVVKEEKRKFRGLIKDSQGYSVYFGFKDLTENFPIAIGDKVEYIVRSTSDGKARASKVRKAKPPATSTPAFLRSVSAETRTSSSGYSSPQFPMSPTQAKMFSLMETSEEKSREMDAEAVRHLHLEQANKSSTGKSEGFRAIRGVPIQKRSYSVGAAHSEPSTADSGAGAVAGASGQWSG